MSRRAGWIDGLSTESDIFGQLRPEAEAFLRDVEASPLDSLLAEARALREVGHGLNISYSRKVFVPLTRLCRDSCAYCTFATTPKNVASAYLSPDEVLAIARAGQATGCTEVLFTLGDRPEFRYAAARRALADLGYASTVDYLVAMCAHILRETGMLPHVNAGVMDEDELLRLRAVSISQGIMLENVADRLCARGGPHFGSPDKKPSVRLGMIAAAGRLDIPFTSGILIGIGETRLERVASLIALRDAHRAYGHLQEIIIQNFRAKSNTRMAASDEPEFDDLLWTAAVARQLFGSEMNIQVPPNLSYDRFGRLLEAGINDWGGVSPVTPDHVNPEAPWPDLEKLERTTVGAGFRLVPRLAVYPRYLQDIDRWIDPAVRGAVLRLADSGGFSREDDWSPGVAQGIPTTVSDGGQSAAVERVLARCGTDLALTEEELVTLFKARGGDVDAICEVADSLRRSVNGDVVGYVVNRNINYTNVCTYRCGFCAFSKGKLSDQLRGRPYDLSLDEVARRVVEAWDRGATEVCMQGGINPDYTGETYLDLLRAVKGAVPDMHVHAFSPLEVSQGAATLGIPVAAFLEKLRNAGLGSLPGTAAEILDDEVRATLCPDKLSVREWLDVVDAAHRVGLKTTATMMFGHIEGPIHWARHLTRLREQQERTGGFTEFVPLPFVHMESPLYARGRTRRGPTWREVRLVHAVARLALHPWIVNVQTSWVKLGGAGVAAILRAGVNDLGGTLMNESISRAAGTQHGQELDPIAMEQLIRSVGRVPRQRRTLYDDAPAERRERSLSAAPLTDVVQTPFKARRRRTGSGVEELVQ